MGGGAHDLVVEQASQPPYALGKEGRELAVACSACLRSHLAQLGSFRIESKEDDWVDAGPAPASIQRAHQLPDEGEVEGLLQATIKVVFRDEVLLRNIAWKQGEDVLLCAHHGALRPPTRGDGKLC